MSNNLTPVLYCFRDNIPLRYESASCLHPSSVCAYREFCWIFRRDRGASPPSSVEDPWPPRRRIQEPDSSACA